MIMYQELSLDTFYNIFVSIMNTGFHLQGLIQTSTKELVKINLPKLFL